MNIIQLQGALELGLIYGVVSVGVYLSFRVLQFPDLTVDGSFPLGAAVCAVLITHGIHPILALFFAGCAGAIFGWLTGLLSTQLKMLNLLSGILTMSALYSINLRVMGNRPNLSLLGEATVFSFLGRWVPTHWPIIPLVISVVVIIISSVIVWFLGSQAGLAMRATGCNSRMARSQGVNDSTLICTGLSISNACVALGGALFSQVFGFADVSLGVGTIIIGLASVIMGEALLPTRTVMQAVTACFVGAIIYRLLIAFALNLGDIGLQASDLNLITALLVVVAMSLPKLKAHLKARTLKIERMRSL
jgi:putative ABC transport system permease protein